MKGSTARVEQRAAARSPIDLRLEFTTRDSWDTMSGVARDISLGGMFIATGHPAAFGASVLVRLTVPASGQTVIVPGVVRWTRPDGMGVQFGALGARETHAIIEIARGNL